MRSRFLRMLAVGAIAVPALTACEDERAITREPVGDPGYGIRLLPSTVFNFPRGQLALSGDDVTLSIRGLDSLTTGRYVAWAGNEAGDTWVKLTGDLARTRTDTVRNAQGDDVPEQVELAPLTNIAGWQDGNSATLYEFSATAGTTPEQVIVTVEDSDAATAPNLSRAFLWRRGSSGSLRYGNWAAAVEDEFVFPFVGRGRAQWRGNILAVNDSSIARPPRGYFFAAWLVRRDTLNQVIDYLDLGAMTTPFPSRTSLRDADVEIVDPAFVYDEPYAILAGSWRYDWANAPAEVRSADISGTRASDPSAAWAGFSEILITLEHKAGAEALPSPHILLRASVPGIVSGN